MKKIWMWINSHKWVILVTLTILAGISLIFVDTDGVDEDYYLNEDAVELTEPIQTDTILTDSIINTEDLTLDIQ